MTNILTGGKLDLCVSHRNPFGRYLATATNVVTNKLL